LPYWYRVHFAKVGDARYLSHLEVQRLLVQAIHRSRIPVRLTQGYSPRPKISLGLATPTAIASKAEYLDVALDSILDAEMLRQRLQDCTGRVFDVLSSRYVGRRKPSLVEDSAKIVYRFEFMPQLPDKALDEMLRGIRGCLAANNHASVSSFVASAIQPEKGDEEVEGIPTLDIAKAIDMIYSLPEKGRSVFEVVTRVNQGKSPKARDLSAWLLSWCEGTECEAIAEKAAVLGGTGQGDFVSLAELPLTVCGEGNARNSGVSS